MKLVQIEQTLEIARTGSLSQAAINLYISQPNLSVSIKNLESEIGTPIFNRTNNGMELTPFGRKFITYAQNVQLQMEELEKYCARHVATKPMQLQVGSGCFSFVSKVLQMMHDQYADLPLSFLLKEGPPGYIEQALVSGEIEVGVVSVHNPMRDLVMRRYNAIGVEYHQLSPLVLGVYVSHDDERFPPDLQFIDVGVEENLLPFQNMTYIDYALQYAWSETFSISMLTSPRRRITIENSGAMCDLVNSIKGFSLAAYLETVYSGEVSWDRNLRFIPFKNLCYTCEVGWIKRKNAVLSDSAQEFVQRITKLCKA